MISLQKKLISNKTAKKKPENSGDLCVRSMGITPLVNNTSSGEICSLSLTLHIIYPCQVVELFDRLYLLLIVMEQLQSQPSAFL